MKWSGEVICVPPEIWLLQSRSNLFDTSPFSVQPGALERPQKATYSETLLIGPALGPKNLAFITRWPY